MVIWSKTAVLNCFSPLSILCTWPAKLCDTNNNDSPFTVLQPLSRLAYLTYPICKHRVIRVSKRSLIYM